MEKTDFIQRIIIELLVNNNYERATDIEVEALNYYSNKIKEPLNYLPRPDVPFVIVALESLSNNLRKLYPTASDYANTLLEETKLDLVVGEAARETFDEILGGM